MNLRVLPQFSLIHISNLYHRFLFFLLWSMVKHKYTVKQKANLVFGRNRKREVKQSKVSSKTFKRVNKYYSNYFIMYDYRYGKMNPSSTIFTKNDELQQKVINAIPWIDNARPANSSRTVFGTIMLLQFVLQKWLWNNNICDVLVLETKTYLWNHTVDVHKYDICPIWTGNHNPCGCTCHIQIYNLESHNKDTWIYKERTLKFNNKL